VRLTLLRLGTQVLSYQKHMAGDEDDLFEREVQYSRTKITPDDTNDNRKSLNRKLQVACSSSSR
jgi:hypothetical protein